MKVEAGGDRGDPAQPAAFRRLLEILGRRADWAARILGITEREMALVLVGGAHFKGKACADAGSLLVDAAQAEAVNHAA